METVKHSLVSVIIPAYNAAGTIGKVIEHLVSQTYSEWELIIVDDGSTDSTESVVLSAADPRIRYIKRDRTPKGSVTCRNIGQGLIRGKYFIHFDADDIIEPFCLEQRVKYMEKHPEVEFATFKGGTGYIQQDGSIRMLDKKWGRPTGEDDLSSFLSYHYPYSVWNNIYRTSSFADYLWDEKVKILTDFSYIVPSIIMNKKHAYDPESREDYIYLMGHSNAMTQSFISDEKCISTKYLFSKTLESLKQTDNEAKYKNDLYSYFIIQFNRLLIEGTAEQVTDFYRFTLSNYPERRHFSIRCAYYIIKPFLRGRPGTGLLIKGLSKVILQPKGFLKSIKAWATNRKKAS